MKAILIPVAGPLEEVEFDTLLDIGAQLELGEGDLAGRLVVDEEHAIICAKVEVGPAATLNPRAGNLVIGFRVYGPAIYVRESRTYGSSSMESFDDVDHTMEYLYARVAKRRSLQPPV